MGQEQDEVFVCSDENYDDVKPMYNFNHILRKLIYFNLTAEVTTI
jgi:hypothetical protein